MSNAKFKKDPPAPKFLELIQKNSTELICLLCFLATNIFLVICMDPTSSPIVGHDHKYHYLRVEALKYNIENHNMFSGIDYLFFGGGGYASFAYPEIFLYIPALLRVLGMSIADSMAVYLVLCNVLSYCFMFIFLKHISDSPVCGTIGAVMYVLFTYRLDNIFTRFALGEIQAYVFWPLILYGLYDLIFDEFKKPYLLGLGFAGMLLSHSISTALALMLSVLIALIFIKRIIKGHGKIKKLLITAGCTVLVTAFYWLPLLELLFSCEMSVKEPAYNVLNFVIPFSSLFKENMHNGITGLHFPIFMMCLLRVFLTRNSPVSKTYLLNQETGKRKSILIAADTFLIIGLILSIMPTEIVPWDLLSKPFGFIQFPWRFFGPASILLIISGTIYFFHISEYMKAPRIAIALLTAAAILIAGVYLNIKGIWHADPISSDHYSSNAAETYSIGQGEWLPRKAQGAGIDHLKKIDGNVLLSTGKIIPCERENGSLEFDMNGAENAEFAILPYIWYKGYSARDENGNALEITMSNEGLVRVDLHGTSGKISVEHHATPLKTASGFISAFSAAGLIALSVILYRKRKRNPQSPLK